jgi:hypothetical protein
MSLSGKLLNILIPESNALFWKQDNLAIFYENGPYSLFQFSGLMNLSENVLGCQQGNSLMKIYNGMKQVKSLVFKKTPTRAYSTCTNHNSEGFLLQSKYPPAVGRIFSPNYSILHYRVEICKIN